MHLIGFIVRIHRDARSSEQIVKFSYKALVPKSVHLNHSF